MCRYLQQNPSSKWLQNFRSMSQMKASVTVHNMLIFNIVEIYTQTAINEIYGLWYLHSFWIIVQSEEFYMVFLQQKEHLNMTVLQCFVFTFGLHIPKLQQVKFIYFLLWESACRRRYTMTIVEVVPTFRQTLPLPS